MPKPQSPIDLKIGGHYKDARKLIQPQLVWRKHFASEWSVTASWARLTPTPGGRPRSFSRSKPSRTAHHLRAQPRRRCRPRAPTGLAERLHRLAGTSSSHPLIDIIDINTPNDSPREIAIAAAKTGKHVLCEKPLAMTVKQARRCSPRRRRRKVVHMVCHNYRRIPAIALAKKMIAEGALGQIYHYHARYAQDWIVDPDFPLDWRLQKEHQRQRRPWRHQCAHHRPGALSRRRIQGSLRPDAHLHQGAAAAGFARQKGRRSCPRPAQSMGKVTVDDAACSSARFENGALANLEATRFALGPQEPHRNRNQRHQRLAVVSISKT